MSRYTLAFTPCPNDTFMLGALAQGLLASDGLHVDTVLADIEQLNEATLAGRYDICKISCALYGEVASEYALLDTGAALADGYGPLVLGRPGVTRETLADLRVVAPGAHTSGALLCRHWAPPGTRLEFRPYDEIIARLTAGEYDAGVVIHEARFTYMSRGLHCLADLGAWWKDTRGLSVPLGCYVMRRAAYAADGARVEQAMRLSLAHAERGDPRIDDYVRRHAQELDDEVIARHIALYVTAPTRALGAAGRAAIAALLDAGGVTA